jgi:hypothetical protein
MVHGWESHNSEQRQEQEYEHEWKMKYVTVFPLKVHPFEGMFVFISLTLQMGLMLSRPKSLKVTPSTQARSHRGDCPLTPCPSPPLGARGKKTLELTPSPPTGGEGGRRPGEGCPKGG